MLVDTYIAEIKGNDVRIDILHVGNDMFMDIYINSIFDERKNIPSSKVKDSEFISDMVYNVFKIKECSL